MAVLFKQCVTLGDLEVFANHFGAHFLGGDFRYPAQQLFGFGRVAEQGFNFGRAEVARVYLDDNIAHLEGRGLVAINAGNNRMLIDAFTHELQTNAQFGS